MNITRIPAACVGLVLLTSCANRFAENYQGPPDAKAALPDYDSSYVIPGGDAPIYSTNDIDAATLRLVSKGFVPYGESAFDAPDWKVETDHLQSVANRTGAHAVLLQQTERTPITGTIPMEVPTNSVTYTTGMATASGPGGYATAYGNSVSQTYGSTVLMMPYSVAQSGYVAVFFAKVRSPLGIYARVLTDDEKEKLQTNLAMRVVAVVEGSPAFLADVLPGDYLLSIDDDKIYSQATLYAAISENRGKQVKIYLSREARKVVKEATIAAAYQQTQGQ